MDDITKQQHLNKLPDDINFHRRYDLIKGFLQRQKDKENYIPATMPKALCQDRNPFQVSDDTKDNDWILIDKGKHKTFESILNPSSAEDESVPRALKWDSVDHSCAYDSLYSILFNLWSDKKLQDISDNVYMTMLIRGFSLIQSNHVTFENVRDEVCQHLHRFNRRTFPRGLTSASIKQTM